jgi:hypothetical protein
MNSNCPSSCTDIALLANPQAACTTSLRRKTLSRIIFFPCNTTLPNPMTGAAMKALFDDGTIVASSKLANIGVNDPTTEDVVIDECSPTEKVIMTRAIDFEDRVAIALSAGSPLATDLYKDYDFWKDKLAYQMQLSYGFVFCDGDVIVPRDPVSNIPLTATLFGFISYQKAQTQGGAWVEFKKFTLTFLGDPLNFFKPDFNEITAGITF